MGGRRVPVHPAVIPNRVEPLPSDPDDPVKADRAAGQGAAAEIEGSALPTIDTRSPHFVLMELDISIIRIVTESAREA